MFLLALLLLSSLPPGQSAIVCSVKAGGAPVAGAEIVIAGMTYVTGAGGDVRIEVSPGPVEITVIKPGFAPVKTTIIVAAGRPQPVTIELEKPPAIEETVTVSATRSTTRLQDQPLRVEVVDQEEIDEKAMMTPGSVAMLVNETTGLRVQTTAPSLGRGERANPGAARALLAVARRRVAALRRAGRFAQPPAGAAARSGSGGNHQRRRLGAVRRVGARRRHQSRLAPASRDRVAGAGQRDVSERTRCGGLPRAGGGRRVGVDAARQLQRPNTARSRW